MSQRQAGTYNLHALHYCDMLSKIFPVVSTSPISEHPFPPGLIHIRRHHHHHRWQTRAFDRAYIIWKQLTELIFITY